MDGTVTRHPPVELFLNELNFKDVVHPNIISILGWTQMGSNMDSLLGYLSDLNGLFFWTQTGFNG